MKQYKITKLSFNTWLLEDTEGNEYYVRIKNYKLICSCYSYIKYKKCKHIKLIEKKLGGV